jgi:hypothetical protein
MLEGAILTDGAEDGDLEMVGAGVGTPVGLTLGAVLMLGAGLTVGELVSLAL